MAASPSVPACIVMPVYNEAATLASVLDAVRAVFAGPIVVVDDGSTDGTAAIIAARGDIVPVTHAANRGYGASLEEGMLVAVNDVGADVVITMDCDGQHEPRHIQEFLQRLRECDTDIVSGSRYLPESGAGDEPPAGRRMVNERVTAVVNEVTGWGLTDAFCGFKAYSADAVRRVRTTEPGYAMPLEYWAKAWREGITVCELPVERIYADHDRSFGQDLDDSERRYAYYMRVWERALREDGTAGSSTQEAT